MIDERISEIAIEPERYELGQPPAYHFSLPRRDFFKALGGGILIVFALGEADAQQESGGGRRGNPSIPQELSAWLHIGEDGMVSVFTGKAEVGQDIRTSLTQVVAEELRIEPPSIRMVMADTDLTPWDAGTFGSRTTPDMSPRLRRAAAAARELLLDMAAERLGAPRGELSIAEGRVRHASSNRTAGFGELTKGSKLLRTIAGENLLTPPANWKIAGTPLKKINARDIVTGRHKYPSDVSLPGMLHGKVLRPAAIGARLISIDASAAESLPGVSIVRDGDFTGVVATDIVTAERALAGIEVEWEPVPQISDRDLYDHLKKEVSGSRPVFSRGSMTEGLAASDHRHETTCHIAYIAHAPLEPRAAVAAWKDDRLTVWTGTQRPFGVRGELAAAFRIPEERIRVIVPDTGSGYGGKHTGEAAVEAARLAKSAGKPVRLVWTREEEFTWAYLRPAGVIDIKSGVNRDGLITAWEFHNYNSGTAGIRPVYDIPHQQIIFHPVQSPLRQGSYRALASTANHFAREIHLDELAVALKLDPLEFRLKNLKDERLRNVLSAAARAFGWQNRKKTTNHGFGIAGGFEKGGYVANCVEIGIDRDRKVTIRRIVTAFECGRIINPDGLKNQVEGSIIQGIGGALFEAISFDNGRILNPRFSKYRVPRFDDVPKLETVLLDRPDLTSAGAGECPIVALAPAVSNAVFDASGVRLRHLPLAPAGLPKI